MKAIDLKVNNLVKVNGNYRKITVQDISCLELYDNGVIEPIVLTEDILIKFDFEKGTRNILGQEITAFTKGYIIIGLYENKFIFQFIMGNKRLYYVHQLQNLYYLLTDEELELIEELK